MPAQRILVKRANIAAEILDTERTYVEGLELIEKLFISPLLASAQQHGPILSRKEVRQLFANFPDIITLSKELLAQLEARIGSGATPQWDPATGLIGDIFLRIAPFLKMYSLYLRNFRSALADISRWLIANQAFSRFIQQANASPECKGLTFQSYLLLPVQRIPRYKLLLEDLLKHTSPAHVDHQNISDALRTISEVATFVNENIQEHEMTLSIIEIQRMLGLKETLLVPGRRLIKVGTLTKICRKSHQHRQFYLFSDILLYSSSPPPLSDDQSGHRKVPLEDCKVMDVPDAGDCRNQFTIISREKSFIVYTASAGEKADWMLALMRMITERREARDTLQMDNSLRRRIARARRSTMMQFPRVAENFDAPVWDPDEASDRCYICFRDFTLFLRRHHCRACGKIVCNSCSRKNIMFVGRASTESKEGRGCDQCIARLFGREALESPQSTLHKLLSQSRHSLDPGALVQSLSALTISPGGLRGHLSTSRRPSAPWVATAADQSNAADRSASSITCISESPPAASTALIDSIMLPPVAQEPSELLQTRIFGRMRMSRADSEPSPPEHKSSSAAATPDRPSTPLPWASRIGRSGSVADAPSPRLSSGSVTRSARLSLVLKRNSAKHSSTGSTVEWESPHASARSTVMYDSPPIQAADAHSPVSTMSHNRVSFVSSSCSTVVSDSSVKQSRVRVRRPTAFMSNDDSAAGNAAEQPKSAIRSSGATGSSHCSLVALYEDASPIGSAGLNPSLVSLAAPPQLTLVQAEATAARGRTSTNNGTLCSLCHGDFTIQDSQHQCTSCLSLVCSKCINHQQPTVGKNKLSSRSSDSPKPNFSRILSMYIPEGYEHQPGDTVCNSCATFSSECKSGDKRQRAGVPLALSTRI
ncbi:hypothetical protein IWW39_003252 [Coemansia spiralis]|uniref:Uncharacterized protein n=1 Tax=Coemansia spiralis TaxID=417178 RepID=A0A9W8GJE0_9FUNG|nr:hypothetical protein IWW39_003252 [Coemansia spiralis]